LTALRALAPHVIRRSAGFVTVDLRVTGTRAAPRPVGRLALEGGTLELVDTGLPYEELRARIAANGTVLDVQEPHARPGAPPGAGPARAAPVPPRADRPPGDQPHRPRRPRPAQRCQHRARRRARAGGGARRAAARDRPGPPPARLVRVPGAPLRDQGGHDHA